MNHDPESIQGRIEREEFARGHLPDGADPAVPRPAATTVLARPAPGGSSGGSFEILLLKRPLASRFAAGAYVFPGGVVDEEDASPFWSDRLPSIANLPAAGRPASTAAIRELFEETGILLADSVADTDAELLAEARHALLTEQESFEQVSRRFSATFRHAPLSYFARWVTPRKLARRYDALFFLVALEDREQVVSITDEHDAVMWIGPKEALERFRVGELPMLFPTWKTIEDLAAFAGLDDVLTAFADTTVQSIEPFLDVHGNTVRPRMPDETQGGRPGR